MLHFWMFQFCRNLRQICKSCSLYCTATSRHAASLVVQQIDDVLACGPPDGKLVEKFDRAYIEVAEKLGVVLASRDDPEKSFSATTRGQVLGIWYDSESWT